MLIELIVLTGKVFPFYSQEFTYDPGQLRSPLAGTTIEQRDVFRLEASGGIALSAAVAVEVAGPLGVEARIDTADVVVKTQGARYRVRASLPPRTLAADFDLGSGSVDLERLRPLSLNLRLASQGEGLRGGVSAGVSWLPAFRFELEQRIAVDLPVVGPLGLASIRLPAEAGPEGEGEGRVGVNAGAFASWPVHERVRIVAEGRWFGFRKQTLQWGETIASVPLPPPYGPVVEQIVEGLDPVKFNPTFFHVAVGVAVRF